MIQKLSCLILLFLLVPASGCRSWWQDDRPLPTVPPYEQKKLSSEVMTEEQIVNKIVTDISLKLAVSGQGVCRIVPAGKLSKICEKVLESLRQMGLVHSSGNVTLQLCEKKTPQQWIIYIQENKQGEYFYYYSIKEKGKSYGSHKQ